MIIKLNNKPFDVAEGVTLNMFIESLEVSMTGIAVAVDYEVIPKSQWPATALTDGMELMMIHAVSGG